MSTSPPLSKVKRFGLLAVLGTLCACAAIEPTAERNITAAWVVVGTGDRAIARANTLASECPLIAIDGSVTRMTLRVAAGTVALRPTSSSASDSKASIFDTRTCEFPLSQLVHSVSIGSHSLPVPVSNPKRIAILGDTGCRMKKSDEAFQACNDSASWRFPSIAATIAARKPDLVLHVGDYHYRENACPDGLTGCRGSAWGYGSDVWDADLLQAGAPLLAAAPWLVVRGNHEECRRGGQGWFRYLDTQPYDARRSCDDAANDDEANYSEPYAVDIGLSTQLIVFDS